MLASLHIENIAVIKKLDIDFSKGFTVFTGETGAGKSMILGALGLIIGSKVFRDVIRSGESCAMVSAMFCDIDKKTLDELEKIGIKADEDNAVYIQRNISSDGKNAYRINGRAVSQSLQRKVGELLVNIHGQHDNQILLDPKNHLSILDSFQFYEKPLLEYKAAYSEMCEIKRQRDKLVLDEHEKQQRLDMLSFQINDIESASLVSNEDTELENELKILKNLKQLSKQITTVYRALLKNEKGMSATKLVEIAQNSLSEISDVLPECEEYSAKLLDIQYELEGIAKSVYLLLPHAEEDPERRIVQIEDRLDLIRKLKRKYGSTVDEIIAFYNRARDEAKKLELSDKIIAELDKKYEIAREKAEALALKISEKRLEKAKALSQKICHELSFLDMNKVRFDALVTKKKEANSTLALSETGCDEVEFMISTSPGEPPRPLAKIASGGELSRIMLAIKCVLSDAEGTGTVVFDEIDSGVSGKTAQKIGIKLHELAKNMQVLCVTHSAQVASAADNHFKIVKNIEAGRAYTKLEHLDNDGRVYEIARIMGGVNITDAVIRSAKELLEYTNKADKIENE